MSRTRNTNRRRNTNLRRNTKRRINTKRRRNTKRRINTNRRKNTKRYRNILKGGGIMENEYVHLKRGREVRVLEDMGFGYKTDPKKGEKLKIALFYPPGPGPTGKAELKCINPKDQNNLVTFFAPFNKIELVN